jgi:hypothetical protein
MTWPLLSISVNRRTIPALLCGFIIDASGWSIDKPGEKCLTEIAKQRLKQFFANRLMPPLYLQRRIWARTDLAPVSKIL